MSVDSSLQALIASNINGYINSFNGVKDFHISIQKAEKNSRWFIRDTLLIRIWVEKDVFDAQSVMEVLNDGNSFQDEIKKICGGVVVVKYDIYYV